MRRVLWGGAVGAAAVAVLVAMLVREGPTPSASSAPSPDARATPEASLLHPTSFPADSKDHELPGVMVTAHFGRGEARLIDASMEATSNTRYSLLQVLRVSCDTRDSLVTTQNRDDWDAIDPLVQRARLVVASDQGGDVTCWATGKATDRVRKGPAPFIHVKGASITMGSPLRQAVTWGTAEQQMGPRTPVGTTLHVLRSPTFTPVGSGRVFLLADVEITSCYNRSNACPAYYGYGPSEPAAVFDTVLELEQLTQDGRVCRTWHDPARGNRIERRVHHMKVFHDMTVVADPGCPASFRAVVQVSWIRGPHLTIEGSAYSFGAFAIV